MKINGPIRIMHYPHKAIRAELVSLVNITKKLDVNSDFNELEERVYLNEIVEFHAKGEEDYVYPACDKLRNDISKAYLWDHDVDKKYFQSINEGITKIKESKTQSDFDDLKSNILGLKVILTARASQRSYPIKKSIPYLRGSDIAHAGTYAHAKHMKKISGGVRVRDLSSL